MTSDTQGTERIEVRTAKDIDSLPVTGKLYQANVVVFPGLYIRVGATGTKSFIYFYRHLGRLRGATLGKYGVITLEEAKRLAKVYGGEVAKGDDPAGKRIAARKADTFADLARKFKTEHGPAHLKPATLTTYISIIDRKMLPIFGALKVGGIDAPMVAKWHQGMRGTPRQANQALAILSAMMNKAEAWGMRSPGLGNPCKHIQKFPEVHRDRALSLDEVGAILKAMHQLEGAWGAEPPVVDAETGKLAPTASPSSLACLKLILFSGARREEVRALTWSEVDLASDPPVLRLRRGKEVKLGDHRGKVVALSAPAVEILKAQPRLTGSPYVFPGKPGGRTGKSTEKKPIIGLWKIWNRVLALAKIEPARVHDLRHTFGTVAGSLGLSGPQIQAALNHAHPATTSKYVNLKEVQKAEVAEAVAVALQGSIRVMAF